MKKAIILLCCVLMMSMGLSVDSAEENDTDGRGNIDWSDCITCLDIGLHYFATVPPDDSAKVWINDYEKVNNFPKKYCEMPRTYAYRITEIL